MAIMLEWLDVVTFIKTMIPMMMTLMMFIRTDDRDGDLVSGRTLSI